MKKWAAMAAMLALGATTALAGDWHVVADITATDKSEAREIPVNRSIRTVRFESASKDGAVIVMTMWVREGAEKTEYRVARQLAPGEKFDVDLGQVRNATGFRISDKGPGRYKIGVR